MGTKCVTRSLNHVGIYHKLISSNLKNQKVTSVVTSGWKLTERNTTTRILKLSHSFTFLGKTIILALYRFSPFNWWEKMHSLT